MRPFILIVCSLFIIASCSSGSGSVEPSSPDEGTKPSSESVFSMDPAAGISSNSVDTDSVNAEPMDDDEAFLAEMESEYGTEQAKVVADPLETFNRGMFVFNDKLYFWILKPVATGWKKIVPSPARTGLGNFFRNLGTPLRVVNNLLQGKILNAGKETGKFVVNSIWGLGGFLEVSESIPAFRNVPREDLGQTFGRWGVGNGFYLVLPFLGPSTLRDGIGRTGDGFMNPINYADLDWEVHLGLHGTDTVNATSLRLGDYETMKDASLDPYTVVRDAYIRLRKQEVAR